jgi:hypothetical protein
LVRRRPKVNETGAPIAPAWHVGPPAGAP